MIAGADEKERGKRRDKMEKSLSETESGHLMLTSDDDDVDWCALRAGAT